MPTANVDRPSPSDPVAKLAASGIRGITDLSRHSLEDLLSIVPLSRDELRDLERLMAEAGIRFRDAPIHYPFINPLLLRQIEEAGVDVSRTSITAIGLPAWSEAPLVEGGLDTLGRLSTSSTFHVRTALGLGGRPQSILRQHVEDYLLETGRTARREEWASWGLRELGLTARTLGALRRAGIFTRDQLGRLTEAEIARLPGIGPSRLDELRARLAGASATPPPEPGGDTALRAEVVSVRPEVVQRSLTELGVSPSLVRRLASARIETIGQLIAAGEGRLTEIPRLGRASVRRILAALERYLLGTLEAVGVTVPEIVAAVQASAAAETLDTRLSALIVRLASERLEALTRWRYGVDGEARTLEEVGRELGISRERVRQLERIALGRLQRTAPDEIRSLVAPLHEALAAVGGVAPYAYLLEQMPMLFRIERPSLPGALRLLIELADDCAERPGRICALTDAPVGAVERIDEVMVSLLRRRVAPMTVAELATAVARDASYGRVIQRYPSFSPAARARANPAIRVLPTGTIALREWERSRLDNAVRALRDLGRPSHFREVAALIQAESPEGSAVSVEAVHNLLLAGGPFVRVRRGVFGLAEWDPETAPDLPAAIRGVLGRYERPLRAEELAQELGVPVRAVVRSLVTQPEFTPAGRAHYGLTDRSYDDARVRRPRTTSLLSPEGTPHGGPAARILVTDATHRSGTVAVNRVLERLVVGEGEIRARCEGPATGADAQVTRLHRGPAHLTGLRAFLRTHGVEPGAHVYLERRPGTPPEYSLYTEAQWRAATMTKRETRTSGASSEP